MCGTTSLDLFEQVNHFVLVENVEELFRVCRLNNTNLDVPFSQGAFERLLECLDGGMCSITDVHIVSVGAL
jgi:hypothetical protein